MLIKQTYKNRMAVPRGVHPVIKSNILACPRSILYSVTFQCVSAVFAHGAKTLCSQNRPLSRLLWALAQYGCQPITQNPIKTSITYVMFWQRKIRNNYKEQSQ